MFLLLLMGLGAASVKAQVRIGGNTPPNPAAALDLNADDSATPAGNKGALALPRVSLASTTAQLNGATPITGMLVYNTSGSLSTGIYYWNGIKWDLIISSTSGIVDTSMLAPAPRDSMILISYGSKWRTASYDLIYSYRHTNSTNVRDVINVDGCLSYPNVIASDPLYLQPYFVSWCFESKTPPVVASWSNIANAWTISAFCWRIH